MKTCQICQSNNWLPLIEPNLKFSVTTAGRILNQPLGKAQCSNCGFVQRIKSEFLGISDYYEKDYANYYERPGTQSFHKSRYSEIISWMCSIILPEHNINKIMDVGCGQGWAMEAIKEKFPFAEIQGVEPSKFNSDRAKEKGLFIIEGKIENLIISDKYDLVYSNNVIQHVNDAKAFLKSLSSIVNDDGIIILTCPDGSKPNVELLWSDQNFSFLPQHLIDLCKETGFKYFGWTTSPFSPSLPSAQMIVLTNNRLYGNLNDSYNTNLSVNLKEIFEDRNQYLSSLVKVSAFLNHNIKKYSVIYNFGASYWSSILAAYCPEYWRKINACIIEGTEDNVDFMGKKVYSISKFNNEENYAVVVGTSPAWHQTVKNRLIKNSIKNIITWDHLMTQ
jgi:2-polyprenyl-3-methyl-5-hydroxy-6-metoxy-1,4-benzoquinol methylase